MFVAIAGIAGGSVGTSYPPSGAILGAFCGPTGPTGDGTHYYDQQGNEFIGNFGLFYVVADGSGGSYNAGQGDNLGNNEFATYCFYPQGYCVSYQAGNPGFYWEGCGTNGTFTDTGGSYQYAYYADGNGGSYAAENNHLSWSGISSEIISNGDGGCCVVNYDGNGGYSVSDTCGPSYPPSGTVLNSFCGGHWDTPHYFDAAENQWDGAYTLYTIYADGAGGSYQDSGTENSNPCWYPQGYVLGSGSGENTVDWSGCGSSGTFAYGTYWYSSISNGDGTTNGNSGGSSYGYSSGYLISDYGCCYIYYDGSGGYYVSDNCGGGGCPGAGQYVSTGCISTDGVDASGAYFAGAWQYGDYYTDGNCGTYASPTGGNTNGCYYPSGWKFDYSSGSNNFDWYVQDSQQNNVASGNFTYYTWWASADVADGNGGTSGASGSWNAYSGQQIDFGFYTEPSDGNLWWYQVSSDGGSGYYVSQNLW